MRAVIEAKRLTKVFEVGDVTVQALRGVDLSVCSGEWVAVMGSSGSGKSTLMNLLGCLDAPTSGEYYLDGKDTRTVSQDEYADVRNEKIGFVFQGFNLLPRTTALENVELPLLYDRNARIHDPKRAAEEALERVGLSDRFDHVPSQLSGGQQQRVAIARALVNRPAILLADEPTGNLDSVTSMEIIRLFGELNEQGITIILVTHEPDISSYARRRVLLRDGLVVSDELTSGAFAPKGLESELRGTQEV